MLSSRIPLAVLLSLFSACGVENGPDALASSSGDVGAGGFGGAAPQASGAMGTGASAELGNGGTKNASDTAASSAEAASSSASASSSSGAGGGSPVDPPWSPYVPPANCKAHARIFVYGPVGHGYLSKAFADAPAECADYYIHLPALVADKTMPRGANSVKVVHDLGPQFHAMAEFAWGAWADVPQITAKQKGVEFRKRMISSGYDASRDTWSVNELPSTTKTSAAVRLAVKGIVQGLYEGDGSTPPNGGLVWTIGMGSGTTTLGIYKSALEGWLLDSGFWTSMNQYVRWWGQEAYINPKTVCVSGSNVAQRASANNAFAMHVPRLAAVGPASAQAARAFFAESYTPTQSAFWKSDIYGTSATSLDNMKRLVSTEVYASRVWAASHTYPDFRFAIAWNNSLDGATEAEVQALAARIAASVHDAYAAGDVAASKACSPSGAYTYCNCAVASGQFNDAWSTFGAW